MPGIVDQIRTSKGQTFDSRIEERIDDLQPVDLLAALQVFCQHHAAPGLPCTVKHEGVPVRNLVEPVEVDCGEDVSGDWLNNLEASVGFHLLPGKNDVKTQFPRSVHEIFL